jgi:hypothetical protein
VIEERPTYDSNTGAYTCTSTYERPYEEAPGISPLLVAEVLDHAIFFSLADLGKALPHYEEIALPVEMDSDTYEQYDRTRSLLKDYLIQRRWEGDTTFRGAYLQWSMGWVNTPFRPTEVIHNIKHPISGEKRPYVVTQIPSYGEDRIFAKEQALIDLLRDELAAGRPCMVYLRQTATKDIQPRIESLIRQHVPGAVPYILKNTVQAERREKVIEKAVEQGVNVILCNPELTKTGLDLIFAPTIIYFEIVFNLSTMMQAAARSYRLNQTHEHCKVIYLYYEGTMEQTAVHLMSRKQRAAKLLTGDVGLTGLEALTEGEGGLEEALLDAIGKDEALLDPREMFKANGMQNELDTEDAAFWNVEVTADETAQPDPLMQMAVELGAVVTETPLTILPEPAQPAGLLASISAYLDTVQIVPDSERFIRLQARLITVLERGVENDDGTRQVIGLTDPDWLPEHEPKLTAWVRSWLKRERIVFIGCEEEVAGEIVRRAKVALDILPVKLLPQPNGHKRQPDLLPIPDEPPQIVRRSFRAEQPVQEDAPVQLALF